MKVAEAIRRLVFSALVFFFWVLPLPCSLLTLSIQVKGNNRILQNRFRKLGKDWGRHVKLWLDQPGKKKSRRITRAKKAAAIAPRPTAGMLRPIVRPAGRRHNHRVREGRGFTTRELKAVNMNPAMAKAVGISIDKRRRSRSEESLNANVERLKAYRAKLVLFPTRPQAPKLPEGRVARKRPAAATADELKNVTQHKGVLFPIKTKESVVQQARAIKPEELLLKNSAYLKARRARVDARLIGKRQKRKESKVAKRAEAAAGGKFKFTQFSQIHSSFFTLLTNVLSV